MSTRSKDPIVSSKTPKRRVPAIDERDKTEYRYKKIHSKNKYNVLRSPPKIIDIIKKALNQNLDTLFEPVGSNHRNEVPDPQGKLFIFVLGGISTNEIAAVQEFQKDIGKADIILGGTETISSEDMITLLSHFNSKDANGKSILGVRNQKTEDPAI